MEQHIDYRAEIYNQEEIEAQQDEYIEQNEIHLQSVHSENYMGTDDDMPDSFDTWLSSHTKTELIELIQKERARKLQVFKDRHNGKTPAQVLGENNTEGRVPQSYDNDMTNRNNPFN